jgi:hypothetical protein
MGIGIRRHEVIAVQVNSISITKTGVGAWRQQRPADAPDRIDAKTEDDENRDRRIEMQIGALTIAAMISATTSAKSLSTELSTRPARKEDLLCASKQEQQKHHLRCDSGHTQPILSLLSSCCLR